MRTSSVLALALASGLLLVTGCSSPSSGPSSPGLPAVVDHTRGVPDASLGQLYVVNYSYYSAPETLWVYKQNGGKKAVGQIMKGLYLPVAVSVDAAGNFWVANDNTEHESSILRFPRGATSPNLTLSDPGWIATALAASRDGHVYVVNTGYYATSELIEYPPKAPYTPKIIFSPNKLWFFTAIVGDAKGDLFAAGLPNGASSWQIDERLAGSKTWQNTGVQVVVPTGLAFDAAGNLVVADNGSEEILTFPPGQTTPSNTIQCPIQGVGCYDIAFNHSGNHLWVGASNDPQGSLIEIDYPSGNFIRSLQLPLRDSYPLSVAADPALSE